MERVDVAVVGAGVVGLAVAAEVARDDRTVVVLESHPRYGVETSSRNSEVLHAGIYYPPESLKSRLCHEGRKRIYAMASEGRFPAKKLGKLIVAADAEEAGTLPPLKDRAERSGAEGLRLLDGTEAGRRIPGLEVEAALWCPESGIVDSEGLMRHFCLRATDAGVMFLFQNAVTGVETREGGYVLTFGKAGETLLARAVVNAAGLHSDRLAAMAGIDVDAAGYRLHWCKGSYFRYRGTMSLRHLVYPVPAKHGLGIHLTPDQQGHVRLGPDTRFVDSLDYDVDPALRDAFAASAGRYWPGLEAGDLICDTAGIRPKLSGPEGGFRDFVVAEESGRGLPGWIDLIGIDSPGLTASPAIAGMVARMIE
ncbi:MAG: NAD(P)/FAD-dependent oxidoreductase [Elusimicrobiota bacterium]